MPSPNPTQSVSLTSADKDVLGGLLRVAPDSVERTAVLALLDRVGMSDGPVAFTAQQATFLTSNLTAFMALPAVRGTKYDTEVGRQVADGIVRQFGVGAGS